MQSHIRSVMLVLLFASRAAADVPPPVGYVEACSVEKQRRPGENCLSCSTYFAEADACEKQHGARGYARRCRTRGASTWSEVWCKASSGVDVSSLKEGVDAAGPQPVEPAPTPSAVATTTTTTTSSASPSPAPSVSPAVTADTTPAPTVSSPSSSSPLAAGAEKGGSCGACQVGGAGSSGAAMLLLAAALAAGWARRRRMGDVRSRAGHG